MSFWPLASFYFVMFSWDESETFAFLFYCRFPLLILIHHVYNNGNYLTLDNWMSFDHHFTFLLYSKIRKILVTSGYQNYFRSYVTAVRQNGGPRCTICWLIFVQMWKMQLEFDYSCVTGWSAGKWLIRLSRRRNTRKGWNWKCLSNWRHWRPSVSMLLNSSALF